MAGRKVAELAAEVEALRAEVAQLRAAQASHYCYTPPTWPWYGYWPQQPYPWQPAIYQPYLQTICAAPAAGVYTANAGCAPYTVDNCPPGWDTPTAGCAPQPQVITGAPGVWS